MNNQIYKSTKTLVSRVFHSIPSFRRPNGIYKLLWDGVSVLMVMTTIFVFSISLAFGISKERAFGFSEEENFGLSSSFRTFIAVNMIFVSINIYFGFNTAFYANGELITDKREVRRHYKKNYFLLDLLSLVPYMLYLIPDISKEGDKVLILRFIDALIFIRIRELYLFFQNIEAIISLNEKVEGFFELFKLICSVLLITHFVGCIWYMIGASDGESQHPNSWINRVSPFDKSWVDLYCQSIYWALTTIATVGYGDITPQTNKERLFCMLIMIAGSAIFGYSVNKIGGILDNLNQKKSNLK